MRVITEYKEASTLPGMYRKKGERDFFCFFYYINESEYFGLGGWDASSVFHHGYLWALLAMEYFANYLGFLGLS